MDSASDRGERIVILGDGQMALVLADALVAMRQPARIWCPQSESAPELARTRVSPRLPGFRLPELVEITADDRVAFDGVTTVISAIPTQYLAAVWTRLARYVPRGVRIVSVTKGLETDSLRRPTEIIADTLSQNQNTGIAICVMSGPSIAAELARRQPASLVVASEDAACACAVQQLFSVPWLRLYRHDDVIGVELAGATKNVIALAAGMIDGLQAGDNAKSALLARGLAEIARLGVAMGGRRETFFGVAGVGDLATTCFSQEGRNRTCGERLAKGESLASILASTTSVVEGVPTTQAVCRLAARHHVDMPIAAAVLAIVTGRLLPRDAMRELMGRELKSESIG